jgi:hypothetical protein
MRIPGGVFTSDNIGEGDVVTKLRDLHFPPHLLSDKKLPAGILSWPSGEVIIPGNKGVIQSFSSIFMSDMGRS